MSKTSRQIQGDVRRLLLDSTLYRELSGEVYREGTRPRDSRLEDAVVTFTTGLPGEIQTGVVTVCIYVPDISPRADGTWVEDGARVEQVERMAAAWADSLTAAASGYLFELRQTIHTVAVEELRQHMTVVRLGYSYYGDDDSDAATLRPAMVDGADTDADSGYLPLLVTGDGRALCIDPVRSPRRRKQNV